MKTITKFFFFVISLSAVFVLNTACGFVESGTADAVPARKFAEAVQTGRVAARDINESSGLAASKCNDDVLWTHNDSGGGPYIYAVNPAGELLGKWQAANAQNRDWESISAFRDSSGQCFLYIADTGNNNEISRSSIIYRIKEPEIKAAAAKKLMRTGNAERLLFDYPDGNFDAEAMLVHPVSGDIYVITKILDGPAGVYKIAAPQFNGKKTAAQKIAEIKLPSIPHGAVTGGDISPDGKRVVLVDYLGGYEYSLPDDETDIDRIWLEKPVRFDAGDRKQGEAVTYSRDGNTIFTTSEGTNSPIFKIEQSGIEASTKQ